MENEVPVEIGAGGGDVANLGGVEDEIGGALLPGVGEMRRDGCSAWRAFGCAAGQPGGQRSDFGGGEAALAFEIAVSGSGEPRRHIAGGGDVYDLAGALIGVCVGEEREWGGAGGVVAWGARAVEDRGYVVGEGWFGREGGERQVKCQKTKVKGQK